MAKILRAEGGSKGLTIGGGFDGKTEVTLFMMRWGKVEILQSHRFSGDEAFTGSERGHACNTFVSWSLQEGGVASCHRGAQVRHDFGGERRARSHLGD
jgi:hypothetical protein